MDSAHAPAQTENDPVASTMVMYPTIPMTIDGRPVKTSLKNLTAYANLLLILLFLPLVPENSDR